VRICIAATPSVALPTLNALLASEHEIISVITRPDAPAGRGRSMKASAVAQWAIDNEVALHKPNSTDEIATLVASCDLVVTIGFGLLLPETILTIPKFGFINLHFSVLPRWRGAAPVQRALEAGDTSTGVTVFQLDAGMDTGAIYSSIPIEIDSTVNTPQLLEQLSILGVSAVIDAISAIEYGQQPRTQSIEGATRANKLTSEEAQIDWSKSSLSIVNKIRAFYPNPGAWSNFRGSKIKVDAAVIHQEILKHGEISLQDKKVLVGTGDGSIELLTVKPSGKNQMSAQSWANGLHLSSDEKFEHDNG
jgi:methionyl-tRNA formyltransferase